VEERVKEAKAAELHFENAQRKTTPKKKEGRVNKKGLNTQLGRKIQGPLICSSKKGPDCKRIGKKGGEIFGGHA